MAAVDKGRGLDAESRTMLYEGLNLSQLGVAFRMDHRVLVEKLHGVPPTARKGNSVLYSIHDAAPHLVKPIYDIETYIKKMSHTELPKMLTKEFWAGQKSRQDYQLKAGHLWSTTTVVQKVGELFKLVKMSTQLATDNLERHTELTDKQRDVINNVLRGMLEELQSSIAKNFKEPKPDGNSTDEEL